MTREFLCWLHPINQPEHRVTDAVGVYVSRLGGVVPACRDCADTVDDQSCVVSADNITVAPGRVLPDGPGVSPC